MTSSLALEHKFVPADVGQMQAAIGAIQGRWKLTILSHLFSSATLRFTELRRLIPDVSGKVLADQLRALESEGVIHREAYLQIPPRVEYSLTEAGRKLELALNELLAWSTSQHSQSNKIATQ